MAAALAIAGWRSAAAKKLTIDADRIRTDCRSAVVHLGNRYFTTALQPHVRKKSMEATDEIAAISMRLEADHIELQQSTQ